MSRTSLTDLAAITTWGATYDGIRLVRAVRPGAIETAEQEAFLKEWAVQNRLNS